MFVQTKILQKKTNTIRALEHYDDFYASVYAHQWPSIRLALLCPPKYIAIPNVFTGDMDRISTKLESYGSFDVTSMWKEKRDILSSKKKDLNVAKESKRLQEIDSALESIASTKQTEEMESIFKTATFENRIQLDFHAGKETRIVSSLDEGNNKF